MTASPGAALPGEDPGRPPIRVAIVDDDPMVRRGLELILSSASDVVVVAQADDGARLPELLEPHHPDVVLMDVRMREVDGLTATRRLRERPDAPEVIVLTTFGTDEYVLQALWVGAAGFLLKDTPPLQILDAVRHVAAGEAMLSPSVTRQLVQHVFDPERARRRERARALLTELSDREREIAVAVAEGGSNAAISQQLFLSLPTVKTYVSRLLTKLDLANRVQIALLVQEADLPPPAV